MTRWLPEYANGERSAGLALARLADLFRRHHGDRWLTDLLSPGKPAREALQTLSRAITMNRAGRHVEAETSARAAVHDFHRSGNRAGELRARLEVIYALNRSVQGARCVAETAGIEDELRRRGYRWELAQFLLDCGTCLKMTGDLQGMAGDYTRALAIATAVPFPVLRLRALGLYASLEQLRGNSRSAWAANRTGLLSYWSGAYPPMREHQFCSDLGFWAQQRKLWRFAVALAEESAMALAATENRSNEAIARYTLANTAAMAGQTSKAETEYRNAVRLIESMPRDSTAQTYRFYCEMRLAAMLASRGDIQSASGILFRIGPELTSELSIALTFHSSLGYVYYRRGDFSKSLAEYSTALEKARLTLESLESQNDRARWRGEISAIYRGLVRVEIALGKPELAAEKWMEFLALDMPTSVRSPPPLTGLPHDTLIWYVQQEDGIDIWVLDDGGLHFRWSAVPKARLDAAITAFAMSCAHRGSPISTLTARSKQLYTWLLKPVEDRLAPGRTILIEPDATLSQVPFQALLDSRGHYFGERYGLIRSSGPILGSGHVPGVESSDRALIAGAPTIGLHAESYPPLPDAIREMQDVARLFPRSVTITGPAANGIELRRRLPHADLFHFAGHAVANPGSGGLILSSRYGSPEILDAGSLGNRSLEKCKLAVLSACGPSLGDTEEVIDPENLTEALLTSGVHTVVASRWEIDSRTTADYMRVFYKALLSKKNVSEAIRAAASSVRGAPETRHPYYWAAFDAYSRELP